MLLIAEIATGTTIAGTGTRIGSGRAEERRKSETPCGKQGRHGWNEKKKSRKERVGSVAANPDNLESNKEAGGGAEGAQGSGKISREQQGSRGGSRRCSGLR